jgi:hypothetical protein
MSAAADATGGRKTGVSTTAASLMREAVRCIDETFGDGFAKANPSCKCVIYIYHQT